MTRNHWYSALLAGLAVVAIVAAIAFFSSTASFVRVDPEDAMPWTEKPPVLDTRAYDEKLLEIAHVPSSSPWYNAYLFGTTTPVDSRGNATTTTQRKPAWPVKAVYPNAGALLPFNRIVAYYGNFYSTAMGALGQYPPDEMLERLASTTAAWQAADPSTPVIPAIHYIVETAQAAKGADGDYMARMPDSQIDKALELAARVHGLVFLDFQIGLSTVEKELPQYATYLALPNVHVGVDPEFSMKDGVAPGREIGTYDAADINWVAQYLAGLVRDNHLPPKILVIHRFTQAMVTHARSIAPLPEVQIVVDMDGWGSKEKKLTTYVWIVAAEPVQFTGFKIFYKNDLLPPSTGLYTPAEVLKLTPAPIYIQYQ